MDFDTWAELQEKHGVFKPIEAKRKELWEGFDSTGLVTSLPLTKAELEIYEIEKQLFPNQGGQEPMYTLTRFDDRMSRIETLDNTIAHTGTLWELRTDTASIIRADQIRKQDPGRRPVGSAMYGPCLEPGMMAELCPAFVASQPTMAVLIPYTMHNGEKVYKNGFQFIWKTENEYGVWGHSWVEYGNIIPDSLVQQMNTPGNRKELLKEIGENYKYLVTIMERRCFGTRLSLPTKQHLMKKIYQDTLKSIRKDGEQVDFNQTVDEDTAVAINHIMYAILENARKAEKEEEKARKAEEILFHGIENVQIRHIDHIYTPAVPDDDDEDEHFCPNCGNLVDEDDGYEYNDEWYCNTYCAAEHNDMTVCEQCGEPTYFDDAIFFEIYDNYYCSRECLERAIAGDRELRMIDGYVWRIVW
jgi:hypothetical protein